MIMMPTLNPPAGKVLTTSSTLVNDSATLLYSGSSKRVEMLFAYLTRILRSGGLRLCGQAELGRSSCLQPLPRTSECLQSSFL